jgi:putative transposase
MRYRRIFVKGGTYFFTLVTYQRVNLFSDPENIVLYNQALEYVQRRHPFTSIAQIILPEHIHAIWELPEDDSNYPLRWYLIKSHFSRNFNKLTNQSSTFRPSKSERTIWQRRYWEHTIRDDNDLDNHIDYIHFNPVHHGLVKMPADWEFSTFKHFMQEGRYDPDWTMIPNDNIWKTAWE